MAQTLGDFELLDELGRGGMGVVYRARQTSLEREVAVKVLPPELATQGHVAERFEAEARRMARLSHANIAQVYTVGRERDTHFFAMQLLPGGTLEDRLKRGPLGIEEAGKIAAEVADALEHAHAQGLTHRDIKPANIIFDAQGHAVVTDFGIAKAADDVRLTATGMAVGTPQYMAPEQARGNPTDHRADIYALGAVMYEMVCGRPPFSGETPVSIAMKHMSETPMPPRSFRGDVPEWLQSVVLKALAKEPADRFASAGDMARALAAAMPVGPVPMPSLGPPPPGPGGTIVLPKQPTRQPNWLPAAIGVLVMLGVGIIAGVAMQKGGQDAPVSKPETENAQVPPPPPPPLPTTVTVPGVVGMTAAAAEAQLRNVGGFDVQYNDPRYSDNFAEGLIVAQDPPAGTECERGTEVYLAKSLGAPPGLDHGRVLSAIDNWVSAWESRDPDWYVLGCYAPEASIYSNKRTYTRSEFYIHQRETMGGSTFTIDITIGSPTVTDEGGDSPRARAVFPLTYRRIGGKNGGYTSSGTQTLIFREQGGDLLIVKDSFQK